MDKTVIILGAGASVPYGYPSGEDLVNLIIKKGAATPNHPKWKDLKALAKKLNDFGSYSIDSFLASHPDYLEVGIKNIVEILLECEVRSLTNSVDNKEDFYKILVNRIDESDFPNYTVISFNYDRLLEHKLFRRILTSAKNEKEAFDRLSKIKIIHIHGRMIPMSDSEAINLGYDPKFNVPYAHNDLNKVYRDEETSQSLAEEFAIKTFKTIYTNDSVPNPEAVRALKDASRVFFVGFGFDKRNMLKLGIGSNGTNFWWNAKVYSGTSYKMDNIHANQIIRENPFLFQKLINATAADFFKNYFSLSNPSDDQTKIYPINPSCCHMSAFQDRNQQKDLSLLKGTVSYSALMSCYYCKRHLKVDYLRQTPNHPWDVSGGVVYDTIADRDFTINGRNLIEE